MDEKFDRVIDYLAWEEQWRKLSPHHWRRENDGWFLDYWPGGGTYALWPKTRSMRRSDVIRGGDVDDGIAALNAAEILPAGTESHVKANADGKLEHHFFHPESEDDEVGSLIDYGDD